MKRSLLRLLIFVESLIVLLLWLWVHENTALHHHMSRQITRSKSKVAVTLYRSSQYHRTSQTTATYREVLGTRTWMNSFSHRCILALLKRVCCIPACSL